MNRSLLRKEPYQIRLCWKRDSCKNCKTADKWYTEGIVYIGLVCKRALPTQGSFGNQAQVDIADGKTSDKVYTKGSSDKLYSKVPFAKKPCQHRAFFGKEIHVEIPDGNTSYK